MANKLDLIAPKGLRLAAGSSGIRKNTKLDTVLIALPPEAHTAAVFTVNDFAAAPVVISRRHIAVMRPRYLLINSGIANAGTGLQGHSDALDCCQALATLAGVATESILAFSTGLIGRALPVAKLLKTIPILFKELNSDVTTWHRAAEAIMTTDTRPKGVSQTITIAAGDIRICGIAKGSGMIHPNMATMLAFIVIDAQLTTPLLQEWLNSALKRSFHRITVDGDTSTNDSCVLLATGSGIKPDAKALPVLKQAIIDVCTDLARQIIEDGEGVTRPFTVAVYEGQTSSECLQVARAVAQSSLVKTAMHARDPKMSGRILAAIGYANLKNLDPHQVSVHINELPVVKDGVCCYFDNEQVVRDLINAAKVEIAIYLRRGIEQDYIFAADLSADYVRINAEYGYESIDTKP